MISALPQFSSPSEFKSPSLDPVPENSTPSAGPEILISFFAFKLK